MNKLIMGALAALLMGPAFATDMNPKVPSDATKAAHKKVLDRLPFENTEDFALATRGQLAQPK
ncbi:MAG: hypothetical protein ISQ19_02265, partial [PS1 clade bacterium]|nr:hypothetical protein [PS1 clade bacterium]